MSELITGWVESFQVHCRLPVAPPSLSHLAVCNYAVTQALSSGCSPGPVWQVCWLAVLRSEAEHLRLETRLVAQRAP